MNNQRQIIAIIFIILAIVVIVISSFIALKTIYPTTTGQAIKESEKEIFFCNPPYIRVGNGCCLDINSNKVCDNDEESDKGFFEIRGVTYGCINGAWIKTSDENYCRNKEYNLWIDKSKLEHCQPPEFPSVTNGAWCY